MASIGHVAVGLATGRLLHDATRSPRPALPSLPSLLALSALALLPDLDVIGFVLHIPYGAEWGHRGTAHSLLLGLCVGAPLGLALGHRVGARALGAVLGALVLMSHGLLDAMTTGGKGVALLWPWSRARLFAPLRPIPVAPIGVHMLSSRGLHVVLVEALYFLPLLAYALWPRRRGSG
jgi:inner membrane protein